MRYARVYEGKQGMENLSSEMRKRERERGIDWSECT